MALPFRSAFALGAALLLLSPLSAQGACPGQTMPALPADPTAPHWPVGYRTLPGGFTTRNLTVGVWYPARTPPVNATQCSWDLREHMPSKQARKIPDSANPQPNYDNCFFGLPLDDTFGPYPIAIFVHGTAGFRTQSAHLCTHLASRGFVVVAADYPGIQLYDLLNKADHPLQPGPETDQAGDTRLLYEVLAKMSDPRLAFLQNTTDPSNNAILGHSAGGFALKGLGDIAKVLVPMAASGIDNTSATGAPMRLRSTLVLGATNDSVTGGLSSQGPGYNSSPAPKRLALVSDLGHHFCSDLCWIGADDGGIVAIALRHGILIAGALKGLANDGCHFANPAFALPELGWRFNHYAASAVLEGELMCDDDATAKMRSIGDAINDTALYREMLR